MRYRFGRRAVDFLICRECAVYVAAMIEDEGQAYATLNVVGTDLPVSPIASLNAWTIATKRTNNALPVARPNGRRPLLVEAVPNA